MTNLRARPHDHLLATDASSSWEAMVQAPVTLEFALEFGRHVLSKPRWSRLLLPFTAWKRAAGTLPEEDELPDGVPLLPHPLWMELFQSLQFEGALRRPTRRGDHINVSELRAALWAEQKVARRRPRVRIPLATDSQVALGALIKGRAASPRLNHVLASSIPSHLGWDSYLMLMYAPSALNSADDPTRDVPLRLPSHGPPHWLQRALHGDFEGLDLYLSDRSYLPDQLVGFPELHELVQPAEPLLDRKSARVQWLRRSFGKASSSLQAKVNPEPLTRTEPRTSSLAATPSLGTAPPSHASSTLPSTGSSLMPSSSARSLRCATTCMSDRPPSEIAADTLSPALQAELAIFRTEQFVTFDRRPPDLRYPGYLDLYSGSYGAARALAKKSQRWVLTFELRRDAEEDLLQLRLQRRLLRLLAEGAFLGAQGGPVCTSMSRAVRPPVRSRTFPAGLPDCRPTMQAAVKAGNHHSNFAAKIARIAHAAGKSFWIENPRTSFLWLQTEWKRNASQKVGAPFVTDYCRFGMPWRKRTTFWTNTSLQGQRLLCVCGPRHRHLQLKGYSTKHGMAWTKVAEPYPRPLNHLLAEAMFESTLRKQGKISAAAMCRCLHCRIGEAANPGPSSPADLPGVDNFEDVELVSARTRALQDRIVGHFTAWVGAYLSPPAVVSLHACPMAFCSVLRAYGNWLFQSGEPMYQWRHLCAFYQKNRVLLRPYMPLCWELATRWERLRPPQHRRPIPAAIFKAMFSLAVQKGWNDWALVTGLAFFGAARIGEPLQAVRSQIVLPADLLEADLRVAFVRVERPKTGLRGGGRVQHFTVSDAAFVAYLSRSLCGVAPSSRLFTGSPSTFRRRWDILLRLLKIPSSVRLTPGGLRGGGAVHLYQGGLPVSDLLWRMRLRHQATLEYYLQEVAAYATLQELPAESLSSVRAAASFYAISLELPRL